MIDPMVLAAFDQAVAAGDVFAALSSPVIETPPTAPVDDGEMARLDAKTRTLRDHADRVNVAALEQAAMALAEQRTIIDHGPDAYAAVLKRSPNP